jgi:hypothetical protein
MLAYQLYVCLSGSCKLIIEILHLGLLGTLSPSLLLVANMLVKVLVTRVQFLIRA